MNVYESVAPSFVKNAAIRKAYKLVVMEDENTAYQVRYAIALGWSESLRIGSQTIGPVSKAMNMICRWVEEGPDSYAFKQHVLKIRDFMWLSKDGMMMCGTNGSLSLSSRGRTLLTFERLQGVSCGTQRSSRKLLSRLASATSLRIRRARRSFPLFLSPSLPLTSRNRHVLKWLDETQIRENPKHFKEAYRHPTKGAWPFSTKEQGYTVSDCAAEGMKAVMLLQGLPCVAFRLSLGSTDQSAQACSSTRLEGAPMRYCRHHLGDAEPQRRVRELRAHSRTGDARAAQPRRGVWEHHDRVLLSRMHDGL